MLGPWEMQEDAPALPLAPQSPGESPQTACEHSTKITPQAGDGAARVPRRDPRAAQGGRESPRALPVGGRSPGSPPSLSRAAALCKAPRGGMLRGTLLSQGTPQSPPRAPPSSSPPHPGTANAPGVPRDPQRIPKRSARSLNVQNSKYSPWESPAPSSAQDVAKSVAYIYMYIIFCNSQPAAKATSSQKQQ